MGILDIFKTELKQIKETVIQKEDDQQVSSTTDIQNEDDQQVSSTIVMRRRKRPQSDVPQEIITHYIVKDYQRMFNEVERLRMLGQQAAREVRKVLAQVETTRAENDVIKKKNKELTEENAKLKTEVNNLKQMQSEHGSDAIKTLTRIKQIVEARTYL